MLVISTSRGDLGHLLPLVETLGDDPRFLVNFLVLGSELGELIPTEKVNSLRYSSHVADQMVLPRKDQDWSNYLSHVIAEVCARASALNFDCAILLGDRIELLAVASALLSQKIPMVHLHGGELSQGAIDDLVRNAISKVAALHFPAYEEAGDRIVAMQEPTERISIEGALAVDNLTRIKITPRRAIEQSLGITFADKFALVTFHPVTASSSGAAEMNIFFEELAAADMQLLITPPNQDPGSDKVIERIQLLEKSNPGRVMLLPSLGVDLYISLMYSAGLVVGNSSSGILDAPIAGVTSIDFGTRQALRWRPATVISVPAIHGALRSVLKNPLLFVRPEPTKSFGRPGVSKRIAEGLIAKRHLLTMQK